MLNWSNSANKKGPVIIITSLLLPHKFLEFFKQLLHLPARFVES